MEACRVAMGSKVQVTGIGTASDGTQSYRRGNGAFVGVDNVELGDGGQRRPWSRPQRKIGNETYKTKCGRVAAHNAKASGGEHRRPQTHTRPSSLQVFTSWPSSHMSGYRHMNGGG
eukprot:Gb_32697 [translate_table: standard]